MSILIKGMKMPKRCADCPMCYDFISCQLEGKAFGEIDCIEIRADWCPLIEVPPHGDLIDRDALMKDGWLSLWKRVNYMGGYAIHDLPLINPSISIVIESEK